MATACGPKLVSILNVNVWLIVGGEVVMSSRTSVLSASLTTKATLLPNQAAPCGSFPTTKFEITAFVVRFRSEAVFACPRTRPGNNSVPINSATVANFISPPVRPKRGRRIRPLLRGAVNRYLQRLVAPTTAPGPIPTGLGGVGTDTAC